MSPADRDAAAFIFSRPGEAPLARRRYRAPAEDDAVYFDPSLAEIPALLDANVAALRQRLQDFCDRPLVAFAHEARREMLDAAWRYTREFCDAPRPNGANVVMSGHQPAMYHPGVWFKNFVLDGLARERGAAAVNLIIDADLLPKPSLRLPAKNEAGFLDIPFDDPTEKVPYEMRNVVNRETFTAFGERATQAMREWRVEPALVDYWPRVVAQYQTGEPLGASLAKARRQIEGSLGIANLELPQSRLCELPAFCRFAAHVVAESVRFRDVYNAAIREYRKLYKVRSANHPAPELARLDDWTECPFWIWSDERPRRRALFAQVGRTGIRLTDRDQFTIDLPHSPSGGLEGASQALADLRKRGVRLRTRALSTTLFVRLLMCDLFLHGIGGGKYDAVVDAIALRFFGFEAPRFAVASATLRLPIEWPRSSLADVRSIQHELRELSYHPERYLASVGQRGASAEIAAIAADKQRWIASPATGLSMRERCRAIRRANELLQPFIAEHRQNLERKLPMVAHEARRRTALASREYAWCLHPLEKIRGFMAGNSRRQNII